MPGKSKKSEKRKRKKSKLTNEEILKIIKKLKPKTQQVVRINIGDKEGKKKEEQAKQTQVRSEVSYFQAPPPTAYFQPPQPPLPMHKAQPDLAETKSSFQVPTEKEKFVPKKSKERKPKRIELQPEEYTYEVEEEPPSLSRPSSATTFSMPDKFRQSILGAYASQPSRYYNPVENDPFQPELIQTNITQDQIGNRSSFNMSSDTWTLAPDGNVESVEEMQQKQQQEPPAEPQLTEEELIQQQQDLLRQQQEEEQTGALIESIAQDVNRQQEAQFLKSRPQLPFESGSESGYMSEILPSNMRIDEINSMIRDGILDITEFRLPDKVLFKSGQKKGQIRNTITSGELAPVLASISKRGLVPKARRTNI